jgi:endoglucanase
MGWTALDEESDYMQLVKHELEAKRLLDTDQWMGWLPNTTAKEFIRGLSQYIAETVGDKEIETDSVYCYLKQSALCGYTATLMQPSYAKLFSGMTEERIDKVMQSFAFNNCKVNEGLVDVLKKHMNA